MRQHEIGRARREQAWAHDACNLPGGNRSVCAIARRGAPLATIDQLSPGELHVPRPLPRPRADDESDTPLLALDGLLSHLDAVYGFAFVLTGGDAARAESLTEHAFASVHDELWSTLGGRSLRDRLLARSVIAYREASADSATRLSTPPPQVADVSQSLRELILGLPWQERAAVALVDQLGLEYEAGAAVLGTDVAGFRALLHRGRSVLFAAHRAVAR